jgi:hypothetical protein
LETVQLSEKILDIELFSNMYMLGMNAGIEPSNVGHPRAACSGDRVELGVLLASRLYGSSGLASLARG